MNEPVQRVPTFGAKIYCGLRVYRSQELHTIDEVRFICQQYCDFLGQCVTVTPTEFIYTNGSEPGVVVGFINYPRFRAAPESIRERALNLAAMLKGNLGQNRVSVELPDETIMLGTTP